jgi:hypothetical protein
MTNSFRARPAFRRGLGFGVSVLAITAASQAAAQTAPACVPNEAGYCQVTNTGSSGTITLTSPAKLVNTGAISGTTGVAVTSAVVPLDEATLVMLTIENRAGGSITGTGGTAVAGTGITLINAGTITGNVTGITTYVADGGTITGNLQLGQPVASDFTGQFFVERNPTLGISGTISAGSGIDFYVRSYAASAEVVLGGVLPTSFEVGGVEARGAGTVITTTAAAGTTVGGLMLMGNGSIVNNATIGLFSSVGAGFPVGAQIFPYAINYAGVPETSAQVALRFLTPGANPALQSSYVNYTLPVGAALTAFTNNGTVNGDIRMTTGGFVNAGTINLVTRGQGTVIFTAEDRDFLFNNSGTITYTDTGARTGSALIEANYLGDESTESAVRIRTLLASEGKAARIANSGSIAGGLSASIVARTLTFENSGAIRGANTANAFAYGVDLAVGSAADLDDEVDETILADSVTFLNAATGTIADGVRIDATASTLSFENRGAITGHPEDNRAVSIDQYGLEDEDENSADTTAFTFVNSGTLTGDVVLNTSAVANSVTNSGTITMPVVAGFYADGFYSEALEIAAETNAANSVSFVNTGSVIQNNRAATAVSLEIETNDDGAAATIGVVNSGVIRSDAGATRTPAQYSYDPNGPAYLNPSVALAIQAGDVAGVSTATIENQAGGIISAIGTLAGNQPTGFTDLGVRDATIGIYANADVVNITNAGTIQGGNSVTIPATATIPDDNFETPEGVLGGAIHTVNSVDRIVNTSTGTITGDVELNDGGDTFENYGTITGRVSLGSGDDTFQFGMQTGVLNGTVYGGAGTDTLLFDITGTPGIVDDALRAKFFEFEIERLIGVGTIVTDDEVVIADGGTLILGADSVIDRPGQTAISGGDGDESVTNAGTVNGDVDLGDGDNAVTNSGTVNGDVVVGDGSNTIANSGTVSGSIVAGDGGNQLSNTGTVGGSVTTGSGADALVNTGTIAGPVDLGGGNDSLVVGATGSFGGTVSGGTGSDSLSFGTPAAPFTAAELNGSTFTGFETVNTTGTLGISGNFAAQTFNVQAGQLIGRPGSVLTGNVNVGANATFATVGQVVGNVSVGSGGTLSPGNSPGIATIVGNVALASGSTTLFEFVPAPGQSDQLLISGALNIAAGARLNMTGNRPLTPGVAYDMIIADGGITGTFTVTQAPTVAGFLRYTATRLQLLGTFVAAPTMTVQGNATVNYVNSVLIGGTANAALLAAVPSLLTTSGTASPAAFALLNPQAYATASQLGIEHGLTLGKAGRAGLATTAQEDAGLFVFAHGLANWRPLGGDAALGTSDADSESYGAVGGIGYGNANASIGAFVGKIDSKQDVRGLGARTEANGIVAGFAGHVAVEGFEASALFAYDWSEADTRRAVPAAGTANSHYSLNGLVVDASIGYSLPVSASWAIKPGIGITHIASYRGRAVESGSAAFALTVADETANATFVDAGIKLDGGLGGGAFRPWIQGGVRQQLDGRSTSATAGFAGSPLGLTVSGAVREKTVATAGAGASYALATGFSVYGAYLGEFGGGTGHNVNVGIRFGF